MPPPPRVEEPFWLNPFLLGGVLLGIVALALFLFFLPNEGDPDELTTEELAALIAAPPPPTDLPPEWETPTRSADFWLTTDPSGAVVRMNEKWVGTTPMRLEDLRPGFYDLHIVNPPYATKDTSIYLASGSALHLAVEFDENRARSDESAAQDTRDAPSLPRRLSRQGGSAGGGVSAPSAEPAPARKPAEEPAPRFDVATPEQVRQVTHTGSLSITSNPPGAIVMVDGVPFGRAPISLSDLRPGSYVVTLTLPGYVPLSYQADVTAQSVAVVKGLFPTPSEQ